MTPHHDAKVDILLATYNGARYVKCQIESLLELMRPGWRILVRDDGSSDETPAILQRFSAWWPECITVIPNGGQRLGPSGNFARLMQCATGDYLMFCDQDDVWLADRVAKPLERMSALEAAFGRDVPIMVHTDLAVVDENLRQMAASFWQYSGLNPRIGESLNRLLVRNVVTGCASTINRTLARLACPIPSTAIMHDWWLALIAAACGRLDYLPDATVLYRQHAGNAIGAQPWQRPPLLRDMARRLRGMPTPAHELRPLCVQARTLLQHLNGRLGVQRRATIETLAGLEQCGFFKRRYEVLRHKLLKPDRASNIAWLMLL